VGESGKDSLTLGVNTSLYQNQGAPLGGAFGVVKFSGVSQ